MKIYPLLLALFSMLQPAISQRSWESVHISTSRSGIIRHSSKFNKINDLKTGNTVELDMYFKSPDAQTARRIFLGLKATHFHSGSRVIGNGWAAQGNVNFPAFGRKYFASFFSAGLGGIFMDRHFHPVENPDNQVIGSMLNAYAVLKFESEYRLLNRWAFTLSGGLAHISNGAFQLPNIGINMLQNSLGLKYAPGGWAGGKDKLEVKPVLINEDTPGFRSRVFNSIRVGIGVFQKKDFDGRHFSNWNAAIFQHCILLRNFSVSAGLAAEYTNYLASLRSRFPGEVEKTNCRTAAEAGMEWFFDHIFMKGGVGYYLHKPDFAVSNNHFYYRLAAHYCFKNGQQGYRKSPYLGIGLKAYRNIAQHPEVTGGYLF